MTMIATGDAPVPAALRLSLGCQFRFELSGPTPMIALLSVHESRLGDLEGTDLIRTVPPVPLHFYRDGFGNLCTRLVAPAGAFEIGTDTVIRDSGLPDPVHPDCAATPVEALPDAMLVYLLGSRYCDTDLLAPLAWQIFGQRPAGKALVQEICDYVQRQLRFDYLQARETRTASQAHAEALGVCRDFAHLAITFCRCMNIPARYCTGYLADIGTETPDAAGDFAAWIEVWLDGDWRMFDPRNNVPRIGRVLVARGRDAADVPLIHSFGLHTLTRFEVRTTPMAVIGG
jgi:transglutaminase-like putative cysteine protease